MPTLGIAVLPLLETRGMGQIAKRRVSGSKGVVEGLLKKVGFVLEPPITAANQLSRLPHANAWGYGECIPKFFSICPLYGWRWKLMKLML